MSLGRGSHSRLCTGNPVGSIKNIHALSHPRETDIMGLGGVGGIRTWMALLTVSQTRLGNTNLSLKDFQQFPEVTIFFDICILHLYSKSQLVYQIQIRYFVLV